MFSEAESLGLSGYFFEAKVVRKENRFRRAIEASYFLLSYFVLFISSF